MSLQNPTIDEQIAIKSKLWFAADAAGQALLHSQVIALEAQKDAANGTKTTYNAAQGTYTTQAATQQPTPPPAAPPQTQPIVSAPSTTPQASPAILATVSPIDQRKAQKAAFTGWENDPTVFKYQQASWDIYVATGSWDSPEQTQLHAQAEAALKALNPSYLGSAAGAADKAAADLIVLPDSNPNLSTVQTGVTSTIKTALTGMTGSQIGGIAVIGLLALVFMGGRK